MAALVLGDAATPTNVCSAVALIPTLDSSRPTVQVVTWKPRAERGHRVQSDATTPRAGTHYLPDGTVHAVDDETGEVACGFGGELIETEASWESPAIASLKCSSCEQKLSGRS